MKKARQKLQLKINLYLIYTWEEDDEDIRGDDHTHLCIKRSHEAVTINMPWEGEETRKTEKHVLQGV